MDKRSLKVDLRELVTDVPGLSGAMLLERDTLWVTVWPGSIFKISLLKLQDLIHSGGKLSFAKLATQEFREIEGMSIFMLGNDRFFLYYNGENESYTVQRSSGARKVVKPNCLPISGFQEQWLTLCNGNSLESWRD